MKETELTSGRYEDPAVFQKERTLLREERLEDGQVQDRGILLHLRKVGVDRRRECGRGPEPEAHVEPAIDGMRRTRGGRIFPASEGEWQELDPARRHQPVTEHQVAPARDFPLRAARTSRPFAEFSSTIDR